MGWTTRITKNDENGQTPMWKNDDDDLRVVDELQPDQSVHYKDICSPVTTVKRVGTEDLKLV